MYRILIVEDDLGIAKAVEERISLVQGNPKGLQGSHCICVLRRR